MPTGCKINRHLAILSLADSQAANLSEPAHA